MPAIAARAYGSAAGCPAVWWANRGQVPDPDLIIAEKRLAPATPAPAGPADPATAPAVPPAQAAASPAPAGGVNWSAIAA